MSKVIDINTHLAEEIIRRIGDDVVALQKICPEAIATARLCYLEDDREVSGSAALRDLAISIFTIHESIKIASLREERVQRFKS